MLKNSLVTALRNLIKFKAYSAINIIGLAVGMACCLLISVYVANELSYENFHANRNRIYRASLGFGQKDSQMKMVGVMPALGPAMVEQFPEVENAVRFQIDPPAPIEYEGTQISHIRPLFRLPPHEAYWVIQTCTILPGIFHFNYLIKARLRPGAV